jgi:glyoxylase-like metal-dependent hydrolase (beta-lactamase superfamily II)
MIRYRLLPRMLTLCLLVPLSLAAIAQQAPSRSITEIADGLYRATDNNHRTVFLVTADGIILADPISADFSAWLRGQLNARFGVPVKYVVYSHHHWDHASGGAVFDDTAQYVAHENFPAHLELPPADTPLPANAAALDANGNGQIEQSEATGDFADNLRLYDMDADGVISGAEATRGALNDVRAPDIVFKDRMTITLGGKSVDLVHVGKIGHTDDLCAAYFPGENGIFFVDFVSLGRVPFGTIAERGLDALLNSIRVLEMLDYDVAVGGHGVVGDKSDVAAHRHYLEELRDAVAAGIAAGQSVAQMQASITMDAYQSWINYENMRPLNVLGMYNLLTAD